MVKPRIAYILSLLLLVETRPLLTNTTQNSDFSNSALSHDIRSQLLPSSKDTTPAYTTDAQGSIAFQDESDDFAGREFDIDDCADLPDEVPKTRSVSGFVGELLASEGGAIFITNNIPPSGLWWLIRGPRVIDFLHKPAPFGIDSERSLPITYLFNKTNRLPISVGQVFNFNLSSSQEDTLLSILSGLGIDNPAEVFSLLPLIARVSVEERKTGLRLNPHLTRGFVVFGIDTGLYLSERNLITNPQDEARIREIVNNNFGGGALSTFDEVREAARILVGIGDTRLKFGLKTLDQERAKVQFGVTTIIPSAVGVLLDGRFKKPQKTFHNIHGFGSTFEDVRNVFIRPELGNCGHFGVGLYGDTTFKFFKKRFEVKTTALYETFFNCDQKRLIMQKQTVSPQQYIKDPSNLATDFLYQYLLPKQYTVSVRPGSIFHLTNYGKLRLGKINLGTGYDYYVQQQEEFQHIKNPQEDPVNLLIQNAAAPQATAHKALFGIHYNFRWGKTPIDLSGGGDYTFATNGNIGKDWTLYSSIRWTL